MTDYNQKRARVLTHRTPSLPDLGGATRKAPFVNSMDHLPDERFLQTQDTGPKFAFAVPERDDLTEPEDSPPHPSIPQSASKQHSINSSVDQQSNLSVIDMYGDGESIVSQDQLPGISGPSQATANGSYNSARATNDASSSLRQSANASATRISNLESSRKSASQIRLSIEEGNTSVFSSRDRYGFKKKSNFVSEEEYNAWWVEYSKHCARRKKKWEGFMTKNGLSIENDNPARFPARSEKLKRYIRKGIPAEWRGNAWWYFAKGPEKLRSNVGVYDSLVDSTMNLQNKDTEIIERDLNRTFPDNIHFRPDTDDPTKGPPTETPLIQALRRVLVAFSTYNPSIGYCQSLNFIAGLLLIFMDEERTFWMLVIITSRYLPGVHEVNLEGVSIDQGVLMLSVQEFLPESWEKISKINFEDPAAPSGGAINHDFLVKLPPITLCTSSWFMSAFVGVLPIETTMRVWDCFFYEESSILFKVALSIFKIIEPRVLETYDEMEVFQIVQNTPKTLINPASIFDVIFKRRVRFTNLTQEEVVRCRKYVTQKRKKAKTEDMRETDVSFNRNLLAEPLWQPDIYGFKKGLPGVHWNRNLTMKMRSKIKRVK